VRFPPVLHMPFGHTGQALPNVLRFRFDPKAVALDSGIGAELAPLQHYVPTRTRPDPRRRGGTS
jgi:hypothetical protein